MPLIVPEDPTPNIEIPPSSDKGSGQPSDSSGFGLVNWLFDHINERKPIFLHLYQQYRRDVKLPWQHKVIDFILLLICTAGDITLFLIYASAVALIIGGITFIFVKGSGLLALFGLG